MDHTHNGKRNHAIGQEVIVQAGEISSTTGKEFKRGMDLYRQGVAALDDVEELLLVLREVMGLAGEVLDDGRGAVEGDESRNVVERRVRS